MTLINKLQFQSNAYTTGSKPYRYKWFIFATGTSIHSWHTVDINRCTLFIDWSIRFAQRTFELEDLEQEILVSLLSVAIRLRFQAPVSQNCFNFFWNVQILNDWFYTTSLVACSIRYNTYLKAIYVHWVFNNSWKYRITFYKSHIYNIYSPEVVSRRIKR